MTTTIATIVRPREGRLWRRISLLAAILACGVFAWQVCAEGYASGGSRVGLVLGFASLGLILLLASFGARKRRYRSATSSVEQWLQAHLHLGGLLLVLLLLHSGGRFDDWMAVAAFAAAAVVIVSGAAGAVLYAAVPRLLTAAEGEESAAQLSERIGALASKMHEIGVGRSAAFAAVIAELIRGSAPPPMAGWRLIASPIRLPSVDESGVLQQVVAQVPEQELEDLRRMLAIARERREALLRLVRQQRYLNLLDVWLWFHVPFTVVLLILAAAHVTAVFYYGAVRW